MAQDPKDIERLCHALEAAKGGGRKSSKGNSCKKSTFDVAGSQITVDSWRFQDWDYKRDDLPTYARGLFTAKRSDNKHEIVIRGYDKFFNVNEVRSTEWANIERDTMGPYELSVKENGCIIFMSGLEDGTLLVCSKHSTGARQDLEQSHAIVGERWIKKHLESVGKTTRELALKLREMNATAVGELCDDDFEEHVLAYPPELAGLYIHGLNYNLPEFATMPGAGVHEFAEIWGFKKAQFHVIKDINEVRSFLESCAETGSWDGRDTEGFVIRCTTRTKHAQPGSNWFFKYKFEEPYLMYRQWRECTKQAIAGKPPKFKKHKKITEEYLFYARRQLAANPGLAKLYNNNHGIIQMRDGFLAEKGVRGSDIIAEEEAEEANGSETTSSPDVVLVPIATIGCGKTTVANSLVKLFGFGHVQNDDIQGKGNRPGRFALAVTNSIAESKVVIADRNNHQFRERQQIIDDVAKIVPGAKFVALHYVHEPKNKLLTKIRRVTQDRVLERGDNHQTIHAGTKGEAEIVGIMDGFLQRFQGCDTSREPDSNFDQVINLDPCASSLENLETVIASLYNVFPNIFNGTMPTTQDMEDAITFALGNVVAKDNQHDLTFNKKTKSVVQRTPANGTKKQTTPDGAELSPDQLTKRLEYFGITIHPVQIQSILSGLFMNSPPGEARFYNQLKGQNRIQPAFHVTLIHRASSGAFPALWQTYTDTFLHSLDPKAKQATPCLGPARVRLERVVWDDRIMTIMTRILPSDHGTTWDCANAYPHITIGTASNEIKPKESNDLLKAWMEGAGDGRIKDKEIPGALILDGQVMPFMQRGR